MKKFLFGVMLFTCFILTATAQTAVISTVTDEGAWCWFADPRALHYKNSSGTIDNTYIGYIDVHGNIKATQIDHRRGVVNEVLVRSYFQPDDHDCPTFLVLPDERVMIFYSRHTDEACFYYRISQKAGDITTLGKEVKIATADNTTYPSPFILSDDPAHIYLCWRGIGWHPTIGRLPLPTAANHNEVTFDWGPYQIVRSKNGASGVRPYAKYASNGKDKIYVTYTTTHPDNQTNNWVYFNTIDINSKKLCDITGDSLATLGSGTLHDVDATAAYLAAHPQAVVDNTTLRDWVWQVALDDIGRPVIAMVRISSDKSSHDYYHVTWDGSAWKKTFLANAGGAFHQSAGLEMCYSGGMAIDPANPCIVYGSVPVTGAAGKVYEIVRYTVAPDGSVSSSPVTTQSVKNNARPYIIPGTTPSDSLRLGWLYGDYYDWIVSATRPLGYPTAVHLLGSLPQESLRLDSGLVLQDTSGSIDTTYNKAASAPFTLSINLSIDPSHYTGQIFSMGNLVCGVDDQANAKPYITIGDTLYSSTNVLGSSDVWQTQPRGTGGNWPAASKLGYFNWSFTYENGVLRSYVNGLIDQYIEIPSLTRGDLILGGFTGTVDEVRLYNRSLSQGEIKSLARQLKERQSDLEFRSAWNQIELPARIYGDVRLPSTLSSGDAITWNSSNEALLSATGCVSQPAAATAVTLTASVARTGVEPRSFTVTVMPRDIAQNQLLYYEFEPDEQTLSSDGTRLVADLSGRGHSARLFGSAQANGSLDLTANALTAFSTNGYAMAPDGLLDSLRSYTVMVSVTPSTLDKLPRIYDFGSGATNSLFGRLNGFCAGLKYNGGTTVMVKSSQSLPIGSESRLAFTFDARSKSTQVYCNGTVVAVAATILYEPWQLTSLATDSRNYIGRTQWWDTSAAADNADYRGTLDHFRLFNIALTRAEIDSIEAIPTRLATPTLSPALSVLLSSSPVKRNHPFSISLSQKIQTSTRVEIINSVGSVVSSRSSATFPVTFSPLPNAGLYFVKVSAPAMPACTQKFLVE